ncbi:MAG: nucleoside monophosphate kinase [Candidatus Saccharibacteria bacterium]
MIVFFGPAGAGKSIQGQILAARQGWRWFSMGQLLRDSSDTKLFKTMQDGKLVSDEKVYEIMGDALKNAPDINNVILDGFPRLIDQARWLIDNQPLHGRSIGLVIVLEVPRGELMKRLKLRGRADDTPEAINDRLRIYRKEIYPILNYFTEQGINIVHIDGAGTVGQVHDKVIEELTSCELI